MPLLGQFTKKPNWHAKVRKNMHKYKKTNKKVYFKPVSCPIFCFHYRYHSVSTRFPSRGCPSGGRCFGYFFRLEMSIYPLLYTRYIYCCIPDLYCFCIRLVYLWYSPSYLEPHPRHSPKPISKAPSDNSVSSFPQKKREHFCPRLNIILNS